MSLLDRIEQASTESGYQSEDSSVDLEAIQRELKVKLYGQISASSIARLIEDDIEAAQREVRGALEMASKGEMFRMLDPEVLRSCIEAVFDMVVGFGPIEALLKDPDVTEVMINGPANVFYEKQGKLFAAQTRFLNSDQVRTVVDKILGPVGRRVDEQSPMVSARLPQGHRINVVVSPIAIGGPLVTIRKFREKVYDLDELIELGSLDETIAQYLRWSILSRKNIAVSGGTGSGKTTLLNALSLLIPKDERIVTIEDAAELKFQDHPNLARMEARPMSVEGTGEVTIRQMVTNALRMRPDRIIVGECRGGEALDMLQAMNTGHDGSLTTLHANSTKEVVRRLVMMVRFGIDLPVEVIEQQIFSALDLIVHLSRQRDGSRRLVEIDICSIDSKLGALQETLVVWDESSRVYRWSRELVLSESDFNGFAQESEVRRWMDSLSFLD